MQRRTFLQVLGHTGTAACLSSDLWGADAGDLARPGNGARDLGAVSDSSDWEVVSGLLDDAASTYLEPWDDATCRTLMKGGDRKSVV